MARKNEAVPSNLLILSHSIYINFNITFTTMVCFNSILSSNFPPVRKNDLTADYVIIFMYKCVYVLAPADSFHLFPLASR